ncbi:MAG: ACP S-malonyltransferase [Clostridiales bacterium]|nr:ACP S-malonyltransferase [Clostridiales bacterium]
MMSIAFCYPGQGVQHVGMAEGFVTSDSRYADMVAKASEASGVDMNRLLFEPNEDINITEYTQPALVTACCIITDALLKAGIKPDVTAGLSLGEYCSLYVAGALSFEDAVRLTRIRGRLMSNAVPAGEGTMAAVIGLTQEQVEAVTDEIENVWPANFNCPGQIVITGKKEAVHEAMPKLEAAGAKKVVELNVSGPFHSPLLKVAGEELAEELANVELDDLKIPYFANASAEKITDKAQIKALLEKQVYSPVRWEQTLYELEKMGVDTIIEVGPGKTIAGFVKKTVPQIKVIGVATPEDLAALPEKLG